MNKNDAWNRLLFNTLPNSQSSINIIARTTGIELIKIDKDKNIRPSHLSLDTSTGSFKLPMNRSNLVVPFLLPDRRPLQTATA